MQSSHLVPGVGAVPTLTLDTPLYHWGTLDPSNKKYRGTFEGEGLSVTTTPHAWSRIARGLVGGDLFRIDKPGHRFADWYAMEEDGTLDRFAAAGRAQGLLRRRTVYRVWFPDDTGERYLQLGTRALAESEAAALELGSDAVEEVSGWSPTKRLKERFPRVAVSSDNAVQRVVEMILEDDGVLDGVWWGDVLNVAAYSGPRGEIFTSRLPTWQTTPVDPARVMDAEDEYESDEFADEETVGARLHLVRDDPATLFGRIKTRVVRALDSIFGRNPSATELLDAIGLPIHQIPLLGPPAGQIADLATKILFAMPRVARQVGREVPGLSEETRERLVKLAAWIDFVPVGPLGSAALLLGFTAATMGVAPARAAHGVSVDIAGRLRRYLRGELGGLHHLRLTPGPGEEPDPFGPAGGGRTRHLDDVVPTLADVLRADRLAQILHTTGRPADFLVDLAIVLHAATLAGERPNVDATIEQLADAAARPRRIAAGRVGSRPYDEIMAALRAGQSWHLSGAFLPPPHPHPLVPGPHPLAPWPSPLLRTDPNLQRDSMEPRWDAAATTDGALLLLGGLQTLMGWALDRMALTRRGQRSPTNELLQVPHLRDRWEFLDGGGRWPNTYHWSDADAFSYTRIWQAIKGTRRPILIVTGPDDPFPNVTVDVRFLISQWATSAGELWQIRHATPPWKGSGMAHQGGSFLSATERILARLAHDITNRPSTDPAYRMALGRWTDWWWRRTLEGAYRNPTLEGCEMLAISYGLDFGRHGYRPDLGRSQSFVPVRVQRAALAEAVRLAMRLWNTLAPPLIGHHPVYANASPMLESIARTAEQWANLDIPYPRVADLANSVYLRELWDLLDAHGRSPRISPLLEAFMYYLPHHHWQRAFFQLGAVWETLATELPPTILAAALGSPEPYGTVWWRGLRNRLAATNLWDPTEEPPSRWVEDRPSY